MASKTWTAGTVIDSPWLQDVNDHVYKSKNVSGFDEINVSAFPYNADPTGVTNAKPAFDLAIANLTAGKKLVARGTFMFVNEVWLTKSNVIYDFENAVFNFTAQTGYGGGFIVGDLTSTTTIPTNVTILGGNYNPAGDAAAYPLANWNPIAVIVGKNILIHRPRLFPKQSTRAISLQTDTTWGGATPTKIDNVIIHQAQIIGDGNAVDGVDITSGGATGLIKNIWVSATVTGCKRNVNVSPGNDSYMFDNINIDVIGNGASEVGTNISRCTNSNFKLVLNGCTKTGYTDRQLVNCNVDLKIIGTGGALLNGAEIVEGTTTGASEYNITVKGAFASGLIPNKHEAVYKYVKIEGAVTPFTTSGFRSTWGTIVLKDCTNEIGSLVSSTDTYGEVILHNTGTSPKVIHRSYSAASGASPARYSLDLHNEATITIAAGATAQPYGATATFGGFLIVHGTGGTGDQGMFQVANGLTKLVSDTGTSYSNTSGTASRVNVYLSASVLTIQNNLAVPVTIRVFGIRLRNSP